MCTDPNNVADRILAGFISSLFLAPVQKVFPKLFRLINTFRSYTLIRIEQLRKEAKERNKQRRASLGEPLIKKRTLWGRVCTCRKPQTPVSLRTCNA